MKTLFLFAAMTYIAALERGYVFDALRAWLVRKGLGYRQLFWVTGIIAFFLSAIADNLTTSLVMGAVVLAVGVGNPGFVAIAMVNIVSAANSGGAFSPFGDITTLMVWQSGRVEFFEFFALFLPSVACYLVPAVIMSFFITDGAPQPVEAFLCLCFWLTTSVVSASNFGKAGKFPKMRLLMMFSRLSKWSSGILYCFSLVCCLAWAGLVFLVTWNLPLIFCTASGVQQMQISSWEHHQPLSIIFLLCSLFLAWDLR